MNRCFKHSRLPSSERPGKILVLLAVLFPVILSLLGLVLDGSILMFERRRLQQATDAAATAAALELQRGGTTAAAAAKATEMIQSLNGFGDATVQVNIHPATGPYAGNARYAEVLVSRQPQTYFVRFMGQQSAQQVSTRAVAGTEDATADAAVLVLDPDPPGILLTGLPITIPALPSTHLGGLECLGLGQLQVEDAVLVNTEWGGVNEDGDLLGTLDELRYAIRCMPILPLTKLRAEDVRVVGGVDNERNFGNIDLDEPSPLQTNRMPVEDPLIDLPVPTVFSDSENVVAAERGGKTLINIPILGTPIVLKPGVYEWINVVTGPVIFEPGVYVVRGVHPVSQIALNLTAGPVSAEGVMFYITNNEDYSVTLGEPDASDGETNPGNYGVPSHVPSVVIDGAVFGNTFSPLSDPGSPYDGMFLFQRRTDRRPIVLVGEQLLGSGTMAGRIYAKWGHVIFAGHGTYDLAFAAGSVRFVNVLRCTLRPSNPFPPAQDVYLVE